MPKKVVLCLNVPELNQGGWRNPEICKKYPGSGFLPFLKSRGSVCSAGEALDYDPKAALIVQEELNPDGFMLLEQGATGAVLFCLETPLFTPFFYDRLDEIKKLFRFQLLFRGGTDQIRFPSFDQTALESPEPYASRTQKFCMVVSNKHWKQCEGIPGWPESPSWQRAVTAQLHDQRYLAIHELQTQGLLDLYGKGWPTQMRPRAYEIPAGEKVSTMRKYLLGLCIENTRMEGYVTEKIIDCIAAGVVPVYSGAPDIEKFVPKECFMAADGFKWPSEEQAQVVIEAGQKFLRSPRGRGFSYQGFARRLLKRIAQACVSAPTPHLSPVAILPAQA